MSYFDILRQPDAVNLRAAGSNHPMKYHNGQWQERDVVLRASQVDNRMHIDLTADATQPEHIQLRWHCKVPQGMRTLGDHWERGYGDLEWRSIVPERVMPWYFLAQDGGLTHGYGVRTGAGALCFWMVDPQGVSLWLDVRNGGNGVALRGRTLNAAQVVARQGVDGESAFAAARALCRMLCPNPRLPAQPVYGSNNWYYAYGKYNHASVLEDIRLVVDLSPDTTNRPYMVVDAGWQPLAGDEPTNILCGAPYTGFNQRFPDMPGLAARVKALGARPGIWIRPLVAAPDDPDSVLLPVRRATDDTAKVKILDPSISEVLERIKGDFAMLHAWGYDLIKHDWAACDIFGRWGFQMNHQLTNSGWNFADPSRTTAEITTALFAAIRAGSGSAIVIGCNTVGHLGAGYFDLQRTGDDTSGRQWERTRKMGVNTLAFRLPQHNAFFSADPDCVGHTKDTPWVMNRQFLDLVARSGAPLFISISPADVGAEQESALRAALAAAARPQPPAEPLDWLETTTPQSWRLGDEVVHYDWYGEGGVNPF